MLVKLGLIRQELSKFHLDREEVAATQMQCEEDEDDWYDISQEEYDEDSEDFLLFGKKVSMSDVHNMLMFSMNTQQMMDVARLRFGLQKTNLK